MSLRTYFAAVVASFILAGSAQAQVEIQAKVPVQQIQLRSMLKIPDPRGEFVRQCAPHMMGRASQSEVAPCMITAAAVKTPTCAKRCAASDRCHHGTIAAKLP
jgi:hypothetical protein